MCIRDRRGLDADGGNGTIDSPIGTSLITSTTDDFNTSTIRTVNNCDGIDCYTSTPAGSGSPVPHAIAEAIIIFSASLTHTEVQNDDIISGAITISANAPEDPPTTVYVQTNSKTFDSNVKSIFVTANKVLNGDSTITVDVSSDGGSTWDVTNQNLDEWIQLDGDGSDIVVKFNLNVDGSGNSPELYGYSYMVRV